MNLQDIDESTFVPGILCLTSSEVCRLHSASKALKGLFEAPGESRLFSQRHTFLTEANKGVLGFVNPDCIYLHALLDRPSMTAVAQKLSEMRNPIRGLLKFHCPSEAACFVHTMDRVRSSKDFVIPWNFDLVHGENRPAAKCHGCNVSAGHDDIVWLSLPVRFSSSFLQFSIQLCATRTSGGSICFLWKVCFTCMLMEEADMVSLQIGGCIATPFGSVTLPAATVQPNDILHNNADISRLAYTRSDESASRLLAETWLHNRMLTQAPLISVVSIEFLMLGSAVAVIQSSD